MTEAVRRHERLHRQPSAQLISDAVVASYIHDITGHHRPRDNANQRALFELRRRVRRQWAAESKRPNRVLTTEANQR